MPIVKRLRAAATAAVMRYPDHWRVNAYFINHIVTKIPLIGIRLLLMERLGVEFEDRASTAILVGTQIWFPQNVRIGADTVINRECRLDAGGMITIGKSVSISNGVRLQTGRHNIASSLFEACYEEIRIADLAWVCEGAIVTGGVNIGEGAVVMAGAVVVQDVAAWSIVGGVPAKHVAVRPKVQYHIGWRPDFA